MEANEDRGGRKLAVGLLWCHTMCSLRWMGQGDSLAFDVGELSGDLFFNAAEGAGAVAPSGRAMIGEPIEGTTVGAGVVPRACTSIERARISADRRRPATSWWSGSTDDWEGESVVSGA